MLRPLIAANTMGNMVGPFSPSAHGLIEEYIFTDQAHSNFNFLAKLRITAGLAI